MTRLLTVVTLCALLLSANADTLELMDGTVLQGCFIRDEGVRLLVWENMQQVGGPAKAYPRSMVKQFRVERDDTWDARPNLPDLTVTFIELNPKLAGLHGRVHYDQWGRPKIAGASVLPDLGEESYLKPEEIVKGLKLKYQPGEPVTLTAHVKNVGFTTAQPFDYVWLIDGKEVSRGRYQQRLREMEEATFTLKWNWQEGFHHVTFRIITNQKEIATINNEVTDPLWGWGFFYIVSNKRVQMWHTFRSAAGTFCFEDYYRWHIDIMNLLFAHSIFPAAPEGIKARVRLDRIIYTDDVDKAVQGLVAEDGIAYHQGGWIWHDSREEKAGKWEPPTKEWRRNTEWSLPHELGHQLGLTDWYVLDYAGHEHHKMPDNGDLVAHFMTHPVTMMHWHGPHVFSEADAGYLNMTWDKPRGHFGDHYFAIPAENFLRVVDVNGKPVPGAKVEIFQRGCVVDPNGPPGEEAGVKYFPVIEDGNFDHPVSKDPVIVGETDAEGMLRLPNRPVKEVRTLNGFHRRPNPFGNINVVGGRGLMLAKVTKYNRPCYYWLEITDFITAWFRGQKERFTITLKTPYGSVDSPLPPRSVTVERIDEHHIRVRWEKPAVLREMQYLDRAIGYRVYRRVSSDGLNDRPWFPVATVGPDTFECVVDLRQRPEDVYWFSQANRFAVSTIGELSVESELVETLLPEKP